MGFVNIFSRLPTGFHRQAKLFKLNFFLTMRMVKTGYTKSSSQLVNLLGVRFFNDTPSFDIHFICQGKLTLLQIVLNKNFSAACFMNSFQTLSCFNYKSSPNTTRRQWHGPRKAVNNIKCCVFFKQLCTSMYLCGVNLALNDVENGDVAVVIFSISQGWHHYIFGLKERKNIIFIKMRIIASFIAV